MFNKANTILPGLMNALVKDIIFYHLHLLNCQVIYNDQSNNLYLMDN